MGAMRLALLVAAALAATLAPTQAKMHITMERMGGPGGLGASGNERLCDPDVGQAAGYLQVSPASPTESTKRRRTTGTHEKHYFFWFFEARKPTNHTTMWLTGGPGCSSLVALFAENGPCTVDADGAGTQLNPHSWSTHSNMIYIDQPGDTGFSYGEGDTDEDGVSEDLYVFVSEFMAKYPKFAGNKFHIFGESYGGHYVPSVARRIFDKNKNAEADKRINLVSFGVGNGLTAPSVQYKYYPEMAFKSAFAPSRVSKGVYDRMVSKVPECIAKIDSCNKPGKRTMACVEALNVCNYDLVVPYVSTGYNIYDMRIPCEVPGLCYDFSRIDKYANSAKVKQYLGVTKHWESCNMQVNQQMAPDFEKNYEQTLPAMLEGGVRALIYAGDVDYICNWLGNQAWTRALEWSGKEAFNSSPERDWIVDGKPAGSAQGKGPLTFLRVSEAGHMPGNSLAMFDAFINGKDL